MCGHQQTDNAARMQVHYTKCSTDSVSIPQPVVSISWPCKQQDVEIQGDNDTHVVKTSATFRFGMDIEIMKLFYTYKLPFQYRGSRPVCESCQSAHTWISSSKSQSCRTVSYLTQ